MNNWAQKQGTSFDYTNDYAQIGDVKFYNIPASAFYPREDEQ